MANSPPTKIIKLNIFRKFLLYIGKLFVLFFITYSSIRAFNSSKADEYVYTGVKAFYNYEFEKSLKILHSARTLFPEHPGVHFIWASSKYYYSQAFFPTLTTYDTLENCLNQIEPIYYNLIKENPSEPLYKLYLGSLKGLRARASLGKKKWVRLLSASYQGFKIINDVYKHNPDIIDAQLPIGIIEYYSSLSNPILKTALSLYGIKSSKENSLEKIHFAADSSDWAWIEASGILSFLYLWIENRPDIANIYSKLLVDEFPGNFYFNIMYLESLIRTDQIKEGNDLILGLTASISNLTKRQKEWYIPYLDFQKALIHFSLNEYTLAEKLVNSAINNYAGELDIILGNCFLLKGKILDKNKNYILANEYYHKCIELDNFSYAIKESKNLIDYNESRRK